MKLHINQFKGIILVIIAVVMININATSQTYSYVTVGGPKVSR